METQPSFHYIATLEEAERIVRDHDRFWVSNCGCREGGPGCKRSRVDLCLFFDNSDIKGTGSNFHEVDHEFVDGILKEAKEKHLVSRPFRYENDRTRNQGICFCCDDCCEYFKGSDYPCDKGKFIEKTDREACTDCGDCEDVCYYSARTMADGKLELNRDNCAGCGLCRDVCPVDCIRMVERRAERKA